LLIALLSVALAGHWLDRDGLRDNVDSDISFVDGIYFTAITVTTVGHGDIVIADAPTVVIAVGRDDAAILIVLTIRQLAPGARISVKIDAVENEVLARNAGADVIINPVSFGGQLLAGSTTGAHVAEYISDLATTGGRVALRERAVRPTEVGRALAAVSDGVGVRIYRGGAALRLLGGGDRTSAGQGSDR